MDKFWIDFFQISIKLVRYSNKSSVYKIAVTLQQIYDLKPISSEVH